jgi:hypothetical protein
LPAADLDLHQIGILFKKATEACQEYLSVAAPESTFFKANEKRYSTRPWFLSQPKSCWECLNSRSGFLKGALT